MKAYLKRVLLTSLSELKDDESDDIKDQAAEHLINLFEEYSLKRHRYDNDNNDNNNNNNNDDNNDNNDNNNNNNNNDNDNDNNNSNNDNDDDGSKVLSKRRKLILESCIHVSKSLKTRSSAKIILESFSADDVHKILDSNLTTMKMNTATFQQITSHHFSLIKQNAMNNDWKTSVSDYSTLQAYADAANRMGEKDWVIRGNNWMKEMAINFFLKGYAKSSYVKSIKKGHYEKNKRAISKEDLDILLQPLRNLTENILKGNELIRVIDVGSCYNPFANVEEFDVIALDLCPISGKPVFHCDFLNLEIGDRNSLPIITKSGTSDINSSHDDTFSDISKLRKPLSDYRLNALPRESGDVICMSLVLSYLPTPLMRLQMILKAHQLLSTIDPNQNVLRTGILLIIEKDSIMHGSNHNSRFLTLWKNAICNVGFELIRYEILVTEGKRSHAFAFKKTLSNSVIDTTNLSSNELLWIKQDFDTNKNIDMNKVLFNDE